EGVGRGHVEQIALRVIPDVARLHHRALEARFVPRAVLAAVALQGHAVQGRDLLDRQEGRFVAHWLSFCISSACRSKTCLADCSKVPASSARSVRSDSISWMKPTTLARSSGGKDLIWSITS